MLSLRLHIWVVKPKAAFKDEIDLSHLVLGLLKFQPHIAAHLVSAGIQLDYDFIYESSIKGVEEEAEVLHELLEYGVNDFGLHLGT